MKSKEPIRKEAGRTQEHASVERLIEVAINDDAVFTDWEAQHTMDCSECLEVFAKFFNDTSTGRPRYGQRRHVA